MNTDGTGFNTCKECHKTESLWNHTTTDHKEREQLEDRRNVGESRCNFGDGTDQRVQSLVFMMMMMMMTTACRKIRLWWESGNGRVRLSLCIAKDHARKADGVATHLGRFTREEIDVGTFWIGSRMVLRAGLDALGEKSIFTAVNRAFIESIVSV